jgi:hypothetical protein
MWSADLNAAPLGAPSRITWLHFVDSVLLEQAWFAIPQVDNDPASITSKWLSRMHSNGWRKRIRIHESTQRELCRIAFVCLALLPAIVVVAYSLTRIMPWYESYQKNLWQDRISNNLGVDVRFATIAFPSPERFRVKDLVCSHPETGKEILRVAQVNAAIDRTGWTVDLVSPELNGPQIQSAMQVIHDWFLCRPQKSASLLKLSVPKLVIYDGVRQTQFQDVDVALKPTEAVSKLYLMFSIEGQKFSERAKLIVERKHALESPITHWTIESKDIAIPCRILAERFPSLRALGDEAKFRGTLAWTQNEQHWSANLDGKFESVDLGVASLTIGSPIRGLANLSIDRAVIRDDRLQYAAGTVRKLPNQTGSVDGRWLEQTTRFLQLPTENNLPNSKNVELNMLGIAFTLDSNGLSLRGLSKPKQREWPMIAMEVDHKPIAGTTNPVPVSTVFAWLQSISWKTGIEGEFATQSSNQYQWIGRLLPWPGGESASESTQTPRIATDRR